MLYANTILPDGTRAMIPAAWSDYATQQSTSSSPPAAHAAATLASVSELLHARRVVAPLLARTRNADIGCSTAKEVEPNAADAELRTTTIERNRAEPECVANAPGRATTRNARRPGSPDRKDRRSKSRI